MLPPNPFISPLGPSCCPLAPSLRPLAPHAAPSPFISPPSPFMSLPSSLPSPTVPFAAFVNSVTHLYFLYFFSQVVVFVNEIPGSCRHGNNCTFEYSAEKTPNLTSISPSSGPGGPSGIGTVITPLGSGFSTVNEENSVQIGGTTCVVLRSTADNITCRAGKLFLVLSYLRAGIDLLHSCCRETPPLTLPPLPRPSPSPLPSSSKFPGPMQ